MAVEKKENLILDLTKCRVVSHSMFTTLRLDVLKFDKMLSFFIHLQNY